MPRLSLWRENHSNDYKFIDRRISEMFTIGGTGIMIHKFLGADTSSNNGADATKPDYQNQSLLNIQDLLFVENRDRKYDTSVYSMRGIYQKQDQDFDLSQLGIFLAQGTQFMTFHINDMQETLGRKIIAGDVLELMHMRDFNNLDDSIPFAIKRFYVVSDVSWASEGFSPTWWPHLWRCKLSPLVDSQEYKDILNKINADPDPFAANIVPLSSIVSNLDTYNNITRAIIQQAENEVPKSGYNTANLYVVGRTTTGQLGDPTSIDVSANINVSDSISHTTQATSARTNSNRILVANVDAAVVGARVSSTHIPTAANVVVKSIIGTAGLLLSSNVTVGNGEVITLTALSTAYKADAAVFPPEEKVHGYLTGDGSAPNGLEVNMGITFPDQSKKGDYFLRLDFVPNRLFRYDGKRWIKIEDAVRTNLTPGGTDNTTQRNSFVNDTTTFQDSQGHTRTERVSLSKVLTPKADN